MPGSRTCCSGTRSPPCGCVTVTPTSCLNAPWMSWLGSPICSRTTCSVSSSSGTLWRGRGYYRGRGARARGGHRGVSAPDVWCTPRGAVSAASAAGGAWESRHTTPVHLRRVQIYDWAREPKQLVLYEGAEHRLDECAAELDQLLTQWIPATSAPQYPHSLFAQFVTVGG